MAPPKLTRHPLVSYQPLRLIYTVIKLTTCLVKLPFWLLRSLVPALRQHPKWTLQQSLTTNLVKAIVDFKGALSITTPLSLKPGKQGDRWTVVKPFEPEVYQGPLRSELVHPVEIGGTWYPAFPASLRGDETSSLRKVALHMHGGAFVFNTGRDEDYRYCCNILNEAAGFDAVFSPQYRVAGHGGQDPFPAALQDALTSYLYLVRVLGIPAGNVTITGDSAGGNLAAALLRYIESFGQELGIPRPGHVVLVSPWVAPLDDLTFDYSRTPEYKTDFLSAGFLRWGAEAYGLQSDRCEDSREYINLAGWPFRTSVPVFVVIGTAEILCAQGTRWVDEMRGVEGNRIELHFQDGAPHDTLFTGDTMGWHESVVEVLSKIEAFVDGQ
ncbi:Acetyl-hydrolase [Cytospora mali]|uniref:Acetyl-hydrolase n=1 Tax=Cytospora mali TaxID=578113 RepID=A0A194W0N8_CYTMA|nr:Acetyl-hydrolase [Valsa mali]